MIRIILKRILLAIPVLLAVATITFFLIKQAPGGPFDAEKAVSPQVLKNLNAAYNLDASQWEQYTDYMTGIVQGDFGPSFRYPGRSVTEMILTGLPVTFELANSKVTGSPVKIISVTDRPGYLNDGPKSP